MKHLIVFNGKAGSEKDVKSFKELVEKEFKGLDHELYETTAPRAAIPFIKEYLKKNNKDVVRVYACGGDGTVHECANALVGAPNGELAIYPVGTGNDFAKTYAGTKDYKEIVEGRAAEKRLQNFPALIKAEAKPIDLSKITGDSLKEPMYSINVINFGFDAIVGAMGNYYKEHGVPASAPEKFRNDPYGWALKNDAMKHGRFNDTVVTADGEQLNEKQILLGTLAQGQFVGSSFWCAPKSDNTDGLIDVCVLKTMTFLGLGMIIGTYTKGKHLDKKRKKIVYRRAKKISIVAPKEIDVCVDGEMIKGSKFEVEVMPGAIKLASF
ncbi:MAG: hypothetical protein K6F07_01095 [Bacilli bacterium]|nr:hypothetical protein [Bacilli bacterium]